jgi:hypothetical protein
MSAAPNKERRDPRALVVCGGGGIAAGLATAAAMGFVRLGWALLGDPLWIVCAAAVGALVGVVIYFAGGAK